MLLEFVKGYSMKLILYAFAFVCFVLAASGWLPEPRQTQLVAAGLACLTASLIF